MEFNTFYNKIQTDESMMETIQHGNSEYPFQLYYDDLALFDFHCVEWHWHVEFEFVLYRREQQPSGLAKSSFHWDRERAFLLTQRFYIAIFLKAMRLCQILF